MLRLNMPVEYATGRDVALDMSESLQQAVSEVHSRCSSYPIVFVKGMHLRSKSAFTQDSGTAASFYEPSDSVSGPVMRTWSGATQ